MSTSGSDRATLHPVAAIGAVVVGWALMQGAAYALARLGGLRVALCGGELALALPAVLVLAASGARLASGLALVPVPRRVVWMSLLVGVCFWVTSAGLLGVQSTLWPPSPELLQLFRQIHAALRPSGPLDAVFSVLSIAIAPAVCEEIAFRGVVLPSLERPLGTPAAIAVSAVLFGLIHDPYRLPFAIAIGVGLGVLRLRTGSLLPSTIAHATVNTITFLVAPFFEDADGAPDTSVLVAAAILAVGLVASVFALRRLEPKSR